MERTRPRNDIAHAKQVPKMFKTSVWRNFIRGRVHRLKMETIASNVPNVPYCFATASDWYMAIAIAGGREPLSIVSRMGIVSPRLERIASALVERGFSR